MKLCGLDGPPNRGERKSGVMKKERIKGEGCAGRRMRGRRRLAGGEGGVCSVAEEQGEGHSLVWGRGQDGVPVWGLGKPLLVMFQTFSLFFFLGKNIKLYIKYNF